MRISDWSSDVCSSDLTVRRRLSSWATLHRIRGVDGPFGSASLREAVKRAAKAGERPRVRKSRRAITRTILEDLLNTCAHGGPAALPARALLLVAFRTGGRRHPQHTGRASCREKGFRYLSLRVAA